MSKLWSIAMVVVLMVAIPGCGGDDKADIPQEPPPMPSANPGADSPDAKDENQKTGRSVAEPIN